MSVKIIAESCICSCLHDQNTVAFNGGKTLFGMTAGCIRIRAGFAGHAARGQCQSFPEFLFYAFGQIIGDLLMVPAGIQAALKIGNIRNICRCGE